jgi:hypothetical protein
MRRKSLPMGLWSKVELDEFKATATEIHSSPSIPSIPTNTDISHWASCTDPSSTPMSTARLEVVESFKKNSPTPKPNKWAQREALETEMMAPPDNGPVDPSVYGDHLFDLPEETTNDT